MKNDKFSNPRVIIVQKIYSKYLNKLKHLSKQLKRKPLYYSVGEEIILTFFTWCGKMSIANILD